VSRLKQPVVGILSTGLMVALALGFVSLFTFPVFTGWVAYFLLCLIPMQIVAAVTWRADPGFVSAQHQPAKGIVLTLTTLGVGVIVSALCFFTIGGRVSPPTPMLAMCSIVSVVITFWAAIMWGGWPFAGLVKHPIAAGLVMLVACYVVNYALFRVFFSYGFMQSAPVYVAAQDPQGLFPAWHALVFYLSCLSAMFLLVNFDLWPLTGFPGIMHQPALGAVWTIVVLVLGGAVFYAGVGVLGMDPVAFMVRVPVPFIFGTIVVQNMLKGSLFAGRAQPVKGLLNVVAVIVIGESLSWMYGRLAPLVTGDVRPGPPTYDFEIWLASALLSVTFPLLIFYAEFFQFWPLQGSGGPADRASASAPLP
jgi:hypothetical protein